MLHDLRLAARSLRRAPAFTAITVAILALGVAATGAVFSLVNAVFLEALPFRDPATIALVAGERRTDQVEEYPLSYLDVAAIAAAPGVAAASPVTGARPYNLAIGDEVEHVAGEMVGAAYFRVLGVPLARGQAFDETEARAPDRRVVVLGHELWTRRFGGRADVVGARLLLNGQPHTVVGVAAPGFRGVTDEAQLWLPIGLSHALYGPHYTEMRRFRWLTAVVRLDAGTAVDAAQRRLDLVAAQLEREFPADNEHIAFRASSLTEAYFGPVRRPLWSLLSAAAFVLLIGCTNVANLLLVRATTRRRQLALRVALGAGRARLVRQALAECLVLVGLGAALGLVGAVWASRLVASSGLVPLPGFVDVRLDLRVVAATVAVAAVCSLLFAAVPAALAARVSPLEGLADGGRSATGGRDRRRLQRGLVVAEVALALALLHGAGVMAKGFGRWAGRDLGFRPDSLLTLRVDLTGDRYRENEPTWALYRRLLASAAAMPGVKAAALEGPGLPTAGRFGVHLRPYDGTPGEEAELPLRRHHVTPGYFAALGIPLRAGRDFGDADVSGAPGAVVVGERFAREVWPGESAIGKRLIGEGASASVLTVVGVAADIEYGGLAVEESEAADVYFSALQFPPRSPPIATLFVRTDRASAPLAAALQAALRDIDPRLPFYDVRTMRARLDEQTATSRFLVRLMGLFAGFGLLLAAVGIYGVISYTVAQRVREIGIRVALGADRARVVRDVVQDALGPALAGVAVGLVGVWWLGRFVATLLYGVSAADAATLAATTLTLVLVAAAASWLPARRAARVEPLVALRAE